MKIKIVKATEPQYWYANHIDEAFEYYESKDGRFAVKNHYDLKGCYMTMEREDAIVVSDNEKITKKNAKVFRKWKIVNDKKNEEFLKLSKQI